MPGPRYTGAEGAVTIVPSFKGFGAKTNAGVRATKVDPLRVQVEVDKKSLAKAEADARAASERIEKARTAETRANEGLALAEARLAEARRNSASGSSALVAAENRHSQAKRAAAAASNAVTRAAADEEAAHNRVRVAQDKLAASTAKTKGISGLLSRALHVDTSGLDRADKSLSRATGSALRLTAVSFGAASALVSVGAAAPAILAVGAALATAAGSAALLPAGLAGIGAAVATVKIGTSGIGDAFKAIAKSEEGAATAGAAGARAAKQQGEQIQSAKDRIRDASERASETQVRGNRAIRDAETAVTSAVQRATDARQELNRALAEAVTNLRDLNVEARSSSLSVDEAQLSYEQAVARLNKAKAEGASGLDLRDVELGVRRASISLEEAKNRYSDVSKEAATANRVGVAGADNVVSAQRGVRDANTAVAQAETALAEARVDAAQDNAQAARAVSDAVADLAKAYADTGDSADTAGAKAQAALDELAPNAQAFVRTVMGMRGQWDQLKRAVQQRLFAGFSSEVSALGTAQLPVLERGLTGIAGGMNAAALETSGFLRSQQGVAQVGDTLDNTAEASGRLAGAARPITSIFTTLTSVGSKFLPGLASGFADAAADADRFITNAAQTGQLSGWISDGLDALKQLGGLLGNIGSIIGTVWSSANEVGGSTIGILNELTGSFAAFLKSAEGQEVLTSIFTAIRDVVVELKPGVAAILGALKDAFLTLAPSLPGLAEGFSNIMIALAPLIGWAADGLKWFIDFVLIPFGQWAATHPEDIRILAGVLIGLTLAVKGLIALNTVASWASGVTGGLAVLRDGAERASTSIGSGPKGLLGKLNGLKSIGKLSLGIGLVVAIDEATDGAVANLLNYLSGNTPIDVNDRTRDIFGALPPVPGDEGDLRNLPATLARIKGSSDANFDELKRFVSSLFTAPPAVPGDELDVRNIGATMARIKESFAANWRELKGMLSALFTSPPPTPGDWADVRNWSTLLPQKFSEMYAGVTGWWGRTKQWVTDRATELGTFLGNWVENNIRRPVVDKFWAVYYGVTSWFGQAKQWVIDRATELGGFLGSWAENNIRRPVVDKFWQLYYGATGAIGSAKQWVMDRATELYFGFTGTIGRLVDDVGRKWDELKGFFARPIKWVIDAVWNGTIADLWGKARGLIPSLPEFRRLAAGGPVRGPGTATSDSIPAMLSDGEYVLPASDVKLLGGFTGVDKMRTVARAGLPAFADGGPVSWQELQRVVLGRFPTARITDTTRPGARDLHGAGKAIDIAGPRSMDMPFMLNVNRWIASQFGNSAELIHTQPGAVNLKNGRPHQYSPPIPAQHRNHVHWANNGGGILDALKRFGGGLWDSVSTYFRDAMAGIFDGPAGVLRGLLGTMFPGDTLANRIPRDGGNQILDGVRDALFGAADEQDSAGGGGGLAAGGTGPVADQVRAVARRFGWGDGAQWAAIVKLLGGESSWNPTIKNPTSSAYGLFQFLDATWATVGGRKTSNPGEQAEYGFRYIRQRYRDPVGAYRTWLSRSPHWYDQGGVLPPGLTLAMNETGAPEAVLTGAQWRQVDSVIARAAELTAAGGGAGRKVEMNFPGARFGDEVSVDVLAARMDHYERTASL